MKQRLVIFSGAGMSAESGIQTFRDNGGLWENNRIEDVATPHAWTINPSKVQEFYNNRRKQILDCQPNDAHKVIAALEDKYVVTVITQNIDDLHERAGSENVIHLHGNITFSKSSGPDQESKYYKIEGWELKMGALCSAGYQLRPHVVWFGEEVPLFNEAQSIIELADILIVIGTSLNVYPAAGLIHSASPIAQKILIDPNGLKISVPSEFQIIPMEASEGMKNLIREKLL